MATINMPSALPREPAEKEKESNIDKLMKGLQIAASGFGIYADVTRIGALKANQERAASAEARAASAETRAESKFGIDTLANTVEAEAQAGGIPVTMQTPDGEQYTSLRVPKPKEISEASRQAVVLNNLKIKSMEKKLAQDDNVNKKAFTMSPEEWNAWKKRGVSDEILTLVTSGYGGRNPASTLNSAAERDEPSRDEINVINGFDESNLVLRELYSAIKREYVGPIDGRYPDAIIGSDEAKFRGQLKRLNAAYRRAITGLTASDKEREDLISQIPNETDKFDNWVAKAQGLEKEILQKRQLYLQSLERGGRFVEPFREMESTIGIVNQQLKSAPTPQFGTAIADESTVPPVVTQQGPDGQLYEYRWNEATKQYE